MSKAIIYNLTPSSGQFFVNAALVDSSGNVLDTANLGIPVTPISSPSDLMGAIKTKVLGYSDWSSYSLTAADIFDQDVFTPPQAPAESSISLSVQTGTGAVGTQIDASRDSYVMVNTNVSTTATIGGASAGDLVLEVAPTNSATAGDWVEKGRNGNSQNITLALTLNSVQIVKGQMVAFVPAGYYVKVRSVTASGSPTYSIMGARKVLI